MNEEARKCVQALQNSIRNGFYWIGNAEFSMPCKGMIHLIESLSAQLDQVTRERDAAVRDLERAEESADEVCRFLDNEVHPVCSYALYVDLHNAISEIVHWNNDEEWRGVKVE